MRLSFGTGIVFVPFALAISTEYVLAASYASQLSEIVAGVVAPFGVAPQIGGATVYAEEIPAPAVFVPEEPEVDAISEPGNAAGKPRKSAKSKPAKAHELPSILVRADMVLRIANSGRHPTGKSVTAEGHRPAGVQVFGASSLGVGVRDGDVITRVSGVPVTSPNQVIGLVIAARGAHQSAISAQIYRGQRSYTLTVEQPYASGAEPPPKFEPAEEAGSTKR